jgi:hypothetical protein
MLMVKRPTIIYNKNELNDYLFQNMKSIKKPFHPNLFLNNCHLQTVLGDVLYFLKIVDIKN